MITVTYFDFLCHSDEDIKEFIYEFNSFCDGKHPRYCGNHGDLKRFDGSKGNKDLRIFMERCENLGILIRNEDENQEALILETLDRVIFFKISLTILKIIEET